MKQKNRKNKKQISQEERSRALNQNMGMEEESCGEYCLCDDTDMMTKEEFLKAVSELPEELQKKVMTDTIMNLFGKA